MSGERFGVDVALNLRPVERVNTGTLGPASRLRRQGMPPELGSSLEYAIPTVPRGKAHPYRAGGRRRVTAPKAGLVPNSLGYFGAARPTGTAGRRNPAYRRYRWRGSGGQLGCSACETEPHPSCRVKAPWPVRTRLPDPGQRNTARVTPDARPPTANCSRDASRVRFRRGEPLSEGTDLARVCARRSTAPTARSERRRGRHSRSSATSPPPSHAGNTACRSPR
jgi:hypothetical protein